MIAGAVLVFLVVARAGGSLQAPETPGAEAAREFAGVAVDVLPRLLLALAAVILLGRLLAKGIAFLHQPAVIGEVLAGILLGPSLLGPDASAALLPPQVAPSLGVVAQLGVILYMFLVGLDLSAGSLKRRAHLAVATSHASIVAPFVLGSVLALHLYPRLSRPDVPFTSFALFLGVAMSVTAFPVLARILTDRGLARTELGAVALSCAAVDDVTAWCLLALSVGVARAQAGHGLLVAAGALAFIAAMLLAVRPLMVRLAARCGDRDPPRAAVTSVLVAVLLSSAGTELIGIHAIFGAFLLGAMIPHDSSLARALGGRLEEAAGLLMPAFFAFTGMRTRLDLLTGLDAWLTFGLILLVATLGKFGGTLLASRLSGLGWRDSACLGVLMNTRGLMELVVLNVGLDLGVIEPRLFSMMVLMALATTLMTGPVLRLLAPAGLDRNAGRPATPGSRRGVSSAETTP